MAEIITIAKFRVAAGKEQEALLAFERVAVETHQEDGCLRYAWVQGLEDPAEIAVVEKWRDLDAVTSHGGSPHLATLRAGLGELLTEPPVVVRYSELGFGDFQRGVI